MHSFVKYNKFFLHYPFSDSKVRFIYLCYHHLSLYIKSILELNFWQILW